MKPDCYKCKYRENIPGDCHSKCNHPDSFLNMTAAMLYGPKFAKVTGDPHGVANGWFFWPFNFDPLWLRSCELFEEISPLCKCGHSKDEHDHGDECYHNDQPSGGTGCVCPKFKEKK